MEGRGGFTDALDCGQEGRKETRGEQVGESEIDQQGHVPPRRAMCFGDWSKKDLVDDDFIVKALNPKGKRKRSESVINVDDSDDEDV